MESCLAQIRRGEYEAARSRLAPVVADHPGWARAHFFLALTYHKQHRYAHARELYEKVAALDPEYVPARIYHGWCLYYLGDLDAAEERFLHFLEARPDYPDAIFALGLIDFDHDRIDSAAGRFRKAIALAEARGDANTVAKGRARLADVLIRRGDLPGARAELEKSIEANPENYETYFKLSRVLQRLGDERGAAAARERHDEIRRERRPAPSGMAGS